MMESLAFEALTQLRGEVYTAEKNRFFQNRTELQQSMQTYLLNEAWQLRLQARIIEGWIAEQEFYRDLLAQIDAVSYERERQTVVGIARIWDMYALRTQQEYHGRILPLAWEVITKYYHDWPTWKVITFLYMVGSVPVEESVDPVLHLLEEAQDPLLKSTAAEVLAKLPRETVIKRLAVAEEKHQAVLRAIRDTRDRFE
jgi:hypothetical protein